MKLKSSRPVLLYWWILISPFSPFSPVTVSWLSVVAVAAALCSSPRLSNDSAFLMLFSSSLISTLRKKKWSKKELRQESSEQTDFEVWVHKYCDKDLSEEFLPLPYCSWPTPKIHWTSVLAGTEAEHYMWTYFQEAMYSTLPASPISLDLPALNREAQKPTDDVHSSESEVLNLLKSEVIW